MNCTPEIFRSCRYCVYISVSRPNHSSCEKSNVIGTSLHMWDGLSSRDSASFVGYQREIIQHVEIKYNSQSRPGLHSLIQHPLSPTCNPRRRAAITTSDPSTTPSLLRLSCLRCNASRSLRPLKVSHTVPDFLFIPMDHQISEPGQRGRRFFGRQRKPIDPGALNSRQRHYRMGNGIFDI